MMIVRHTPGPWRVTKRNPRVVCNAGGDKWITKVRGGEDSPSPRFVTDADEVRANASLISTAPELLALVRQFRDTVAFYQRIDTKKGDDEGARLKGFTLARIDDVIAKATDV